MNRSNAHIQLIFEYDIRMGKYMHIAHIRFIQINMAYISYAYPNESALTKPNRQLYFLHIIPILCRLYIAKENGHKSSMPHIGIVDDDAFSV